MSKKRADDMASIEALSQEAQQEETPQQDEQELSTRVVDQLPQPEPEEQESKKSGQEKDDKKKDDKPVTEKAAEIKDNVVTTAANTVGNVRSFLTNAARPGTILLPVGILIFLYFIVIPVNGNSRLQWLWLVLTNNASLPGQPTNPNGGNNLGGPPPPPAPNTLQASNTATPTIEQPPIHQPTYHGNEEID